MHTSIKPTFVRKLYDFLVTLSVPFFFALVYFRGRHNPAYRSRITQRLARGLAFYPTNVIWFHTVSDGEFFAARQLIRKFINTYPDTPILITTTTPTGKARVKEEYDSLMNHRVWHAYLPFDQASFTRRFLNIVKPQIGIFVETEIWPNFLESLRERNIPSALVNARLSEKSYLGYDRFGRFAAETINHFSSVVAQDTPSAKRFEQLITSITTPNVHIATSGNLKYDITAPEDLIAKTCNIRTKVGDSRFWVAASTHIGEDDIMLRAHQQLRACQPNLKLIIAPRHPERSDDIYSACLKNHLRPALFSKLNKTHNVDVIILDSIGQLLYFFAECDLAVIGGSFVEHGGHNPLEACLFSKPILTGPHYFNFQTMIDGLFAQNGIALTDEAKLVDDITQYLTNPEPIASNGHQYLQTNRGATDTTFALLRTLLANSPLQEKEKSV